MYNIEIWQFVILIGGGFITGFFLGCKHGYKEGISKGDYVRELMASAIERHNRKLTDKEISRRIEKGIL